ncbi:hypothetical protein KIW84_010516 [Lathyrus oleraceus]|uniref:DUF7745 domain-containing protein n=1 Tax=Pisum sativum TaxID=3888 RepID=A0A9D5BBI7_PEA|nr:hypothetical protein KIW84_010516 [Pisum sativum]
MESGKKKTFQIKAKVPCVKKFIAFRYGLTNIRQDAFTLKYGKILHLLSVPVQKDAITALAQFYDPPLRSFLFRDFQLAPTLEEFGRILDSPKQKKGPYRGLGQIPKPEELAEVLDIPVKDLTPNIKIWGKVQGIPQEYLEKTAQSFAKAQKWEAHDTIMALLIFGLVLFPNMEKLIDVAAISVFWAVKVKNEDPVPTLLADVYHTLHLRFEKEGGLMLCCIPLLYQWLVSHVFKEVDTIESMDGYEWSQKLVGLTENTIIGSKGCINYNPILAMRQLGYPITYKPDDQLLEGFVFHDMEDLVMLKRVIRAWEKVRFRGQDKGKGVIGDREPYHQWVTRRSQEIKLPFILDPPTQPPPPEPILVSMEKVEALRATIARLGRENEELQTSFQQVSNERNEIKWELERKKAQLEATEEKVNKEEHKRKKVKVGMEQADHCLETIKEQLRQVEKECQKNRRWWLRATEEKKEVREILEAKIQDLTISLHNAETQAEHERRLKERALEASRVTPTTWAEKCQEAKDAREVAQNWKDRFEAFHQDSVIWLREREQVIEDYDTFRRTINFLQADKDGYRAKLNGLVQFCNWTTQEMPWRLREAVEGLDQHDTHPAVIHFVMMCEGMVKRFKLELEELITRKTAVMILIFIS